MFDSEDQIETALWCLRLSIMASGSMQKNSAIHSISLSELKKLGITREYKDLDAASEDEKSRICAQLAALKDVALQQIEERQYADGFIQRHPEVKTIRCYGVAFCRRWVEIAMKG